MTRELNSPIVILGILSAAMALRATFFAALAATASAQLVQTSHSTRINATGAIATFLISDCKACT